MTRKHNVSVAGEESAFFESFIHVRYTVNAGYVKFS
jgi:hypothetical protein